MLDLKDYIYFPEGCIELGIDTSDVDLILTTIPGTKIKREHITASSPRKEVVYKPFYIKKHLISVNSFSRFISETSYVTEAEKEGWGWVWNNKWVKEADVSWKKPFIKENAFYADIYDDSFPVMQTSWNDAFEYTKWLSSIIGKVVRLPYEHEWEIFGNYAGLLSLTNSIVNENLKVNSDLDFIRLLKLNLDNSKYQLGLLWEWTLNWYNGYNSETVNKDFGNIYKILRGGSLLSENIQKSKEFRFRRCPTARSPYYGFRVVVEITS